jgi:hypothetical protein
MGRRGKRTEHKCDGAVVAGVRAHVLQGLGGGRQVARPYGVPLRLGIVWWIVRLDEHAHTVYVMFSEQDGKPNRKPLRLGGLLC